MDMILISVLVVGGTGLLIGLLLSIAGKSLQWKRTKGKSWCGRRFQAITAADAAIRVATARPPLLSPGRRR